MKDKPGVMMYLDLYSTVQGMSNTDAGLLFKAIMEYGKHKTVGKLSPKIQVLWPIIQQRLDTDEMRYLRTVTRRQYAAYVRWAKRQDKTPVDFVTWQEKRGYAVNDEEYISLDPEFLPGA